MFLSNWRNLTKSEHRFLQRKDSYAPFQVGSDIIRDRFAHLHRTLVNEPTPVQSSTPLAFTHKLTVQHQYCWHIGRPTRSGRFPRPLRVRGVVAYVRHPSIRCSEVPRSCLGGTSRHSRSFRLCRLDTPYERYARSLSVSLGGSVYPAGTY